MNGNNSPSNRNRNIGSQDQCVKKIKKCYYWPYLLVKYISLSNRVGRYFAKALFSKARYDALKGLLLKRYGYLWKDITEYTNIVNAHYNARKGKKHYREVKMVDSDINKYCTEIQDMLINKTYEVSDYKIFTKSDSGKERIIHKLPYYPDRIIQWAVIQKVEPIFVKNFIADTYSAIPERGTHFGLKRLSEALKNKTESKYCLKFDICKYYQSIPHDLLKVSLRKKFKDKDLLWFFDETIDSIKGSVGIPIGNYTSQYFGNYYLSSFDHLIKENYDHHFYSRYMDDIIILHKDKSYLHRLIEEIRKIMCCDFGLKIKQNWQIFPVRDRGIDYLGYRTFYNKRLLRKRIKKNLVNKMRKISRLNDIGVNPTNCIGSYIGIVEWCDCLKLKEKYIRPALEMVA